MEKAVSKFPDTFKYWISKHVSHFCGTNRFLSKIDPSIKNICLSCGQPDKSTSHITRCSDPGRIASLEAAVEDLSDWMDENDTDPILQHLIEEYLLGRGVLQMADIIDAEQEYIDFATIHDDLGWDNFVEGRISKSLVHLQTQYLSTIHTYVKSSSWASGLMSATYPHAPAGCTVTVPYTTKLTVDLSLNPKRFSSKLPHFCIQMKTCSFRKIKISYISTLPN
jgi:hypothetical protein